MSRQKQQGTWLESWWVTFLAHHGYRAWRYAEGGSNDLGDVGAEMHGAEVVFECKATERLNVTRVLAKAEAKAGGRPAALVWKRLVKATTKKGEPSQRRRPDGAAVVIVCTPEHYMALAERAYSQQSLSS